MAAAAKPWKRIFAVAVYLILPVSLGLGMLMVWRAALENATVVLQATSSPDGRYLAEVVRQDPGASASYEYMVRLRSAKLSPWLKRLGWPSPGLEYIAFKTHREPERLTVEWRSRTEVVIDCRGCFEAAHGETTWRDISVSYALK